MAFVFMVIHYPAAGGREALAAGMREMGSHLLAQPGLISVDPPWYDAGEDVLIGISHWESRADFEAAVTLGDPTVAPPGERLPRRRFLLEEA